MSEDLRQYIIYRCVVGSRAYGLAREDSDTDLRGCFLAPARLQWSMRGVPEQIVDDEAQECYWELEKLIRLALKSNPNALETLNSPIVHHATPLTQELLSLRDCFPSKLAAQTYLGYAEAQFDRLQNKLDSTGEVNWRHAMHLLRLLHAGIRLLRDGKVVVDVGDAREELLAVRRGELRWDVVDRRRRELQVEMENAAQNTPLPDEPDFERVDDFLIRARRSMVDA